LKVKLITSERALILEALVTVFLMYWLFGFEVSVLATLGVIAGHVVKMSWA
jgi:hypothetical protein